MGCNGVGAILSLLVFLFCVLLCIASRMDRQNGVSWGFAFAAACSLIEAIHLAQLAIGGGN